MENEVFVANMVEIYNEQQKTTSPSYFRGKHVDTKQEYNALETQVLVRMYMLSLLIIDRGQKSDVNEYKPTQ